MSLGSFHRLKCHYLMFRPDSLIQQYSQRICHMLGTRRRQCPDSSGQTWVPSTWIYNLAGSEMISQYVYMSIFAVVAQSLSRVRLFWDSMDCSPPGSSVHGISQAKNTGVGCHFLLQGIFPPQGSNMHFLPWQGDCLPLSHLRSPVFQ